MMEWKEYLFDGMKVIRNVGHLRQHNSTR